MSAAQERERRDAAPALSTPRETIPEFEALGVKAFTTTRDAGTFGTGGNEPVSEVMARWNTLIAELRPAAPRFATAAQVHGDRVVSHGGGWEGWLRVGAADGHLTSVPGTAFAVTVADCVPVFVSHPSGAIALLHSGWRGTAAGITQRAIAAFRSLGLAPSDLHLHLGPSICGACYEVSPDVYATLTSRPVFAPTPVDLRAIIASHARAAGVRHISTSPFCTRHHNERFFSHRAGDAGRQIAVIANG
ncbi:MAG TPA: polyphenol oxidase family protein [Gemmatimonadaceae bacterium]|nr:polyphenol oxidase family protein [Gemmatimonadaceae bacterium]